MQRLFQRRLFEGPKEVREVSDGTTPTATPEVPPAAQPLKHSAFTANLIKGQIAEIIFEQMMRETNKFTILSFGYEKVIPQIMGVNHQHYDDQTMLTIRRAPDFAVISKFSKKVRLVEVKFRKMHEKSDVHQMVKDISEAWDPSYLFLATLEGFYYGSVQKCVRNQGFLPPLSEKTVPASLQKEYLEILRKYEK